MTTRFLRRYTRQGKHASGEESTVGKHKYFGEYNGEFTNNYPEGDVPLFARFLPLVYTLRLLDTLPKMFISVCTNLSSFDIKTELANRYRNI